MKILVVNWVFEKDRNLEKDWKIQDYSGSFYTCWHQFPQDPNEKFPHKEIFGTNPLCVIFYWNALMKAMKTLVFRDVFRTYSNSYDRHFLWDQIRWIFPEKRFRLRCSKCAFVYNIFRYGKVAKIKYLDLAFF